MGTQEKLRSDRSGLLFQEGRLWQTTPDEWKPKPSRVHGHVASWLLASAWARFLKVEEQDVKVIRGLLFLYP